MSYNTVLLFRVKFPDIKCVAKSEDELIWDQLSLFYNDRLFPDDGHSYAGDIIRMNFGLIVSRNECQDQATFQ